MLVHDQIIVYGLSGLSVQQPAAFSVRSVLFYKITNSLTFEA